MSQKNLGFSEAQRIRTDFHRLRQLLQRLSQLAKRDQ